MHLLISKRILFVFFLAALWHFCYIFASEKQATHDATIIQTSPLCSMPREVIHNIVSFMVKMGPRDCMVVKWLNAMRASCRFLHETVTIPGKVIGIRPHKDDRETARDLLESTFFCIKSVINRQGNNHIHLYLRYANLCNDMASFKEFLQKCSAPHIASHIKRLMLENNDLPYVPEEIGSLTELKRLSLSCNQIHRFENIKAISALSKLKYLYFQYNGLEDIGAEFSGLTDLKILCLEGNKLKRKDLEVVIQLPQLQRLWFQKNEITETDMQYLKAKYPLLNNLLLHVLK